MQGARVGVGVGRSGLGLGAGLGAVQAAGVLLQLGGRQMQVRRLHDQHFAARKLGNHTRGRFGYQV